MAWRGVTENRVSVRLVQGFPAELVDRIVIAFLGLGSSPA